jgi:hypothetical protein
MDDKIDFPLLSDEIIDELDKLFPEQSADLQWTDREIFYKSGQRSVVRFLTEKRKLQINKED